MTSTGMNSNYARMLSCATSQSINDCGTDQDVAQLTWSNLAGSADQGDGWGLFRPGRRHPHLERRLEARFPQQRGRKVASLQPITMPAALHFRPSVELNN